MFLEWIAQLGFFTPSPTSRVYLTFPKQIRRTIAAQVVAHLLQDPTSLELLTSVQHVLVVMETIGQAFGLDVDDNSVIMQCAELYRRWLLTDAKPAAFMLNEQNFYVDIFKHMSLLFTPRDAGSPEAHAKMCAVLLETFEASARQIGHRFTQDTWESLLKVLMGICDHLLRLPELMTPLANLLCPLLIKALCIIWIRSKTQNNAMWDKLKELLHNWRHRMPVVVHWNALCSTFTRYVVDSLYNDAPAVAHLTITSFNVSDEFEMEQPLAKYFWYRFLHIMGDMESLDNTGVYLEAFKGIKYLARMFFTGLEVSNPDARRPDGNEILHVFGPFLFDAVNINRVGYEQGKAEAFDLLLQITHDKHETDFDKSYLSLLYRGLLQGLASGSGLLIDTIITHGSALLQSNLRGVRLLIPSFWSAVAGILTQNFHQLDGARSPMPQLRSSCYRIINYLISMPHLFENTTFGSYFDSVFINQIAPATPFTELSNLRSLLLDSLMAETDDLNRITLLSMMLTQVTEIPATVVDFPMQLVRAIASLMVSSWPATVVSMGLQAFQLLSETFHLFDRSNDALPGLMVNSLCDYLDILMHDKENRSGMNEELMVRCCTTINAWVMLPYPNNQWLFREQGNQPRDKTLLCKVLTSVFLGITGRQNATAGVAIPDGASPVIFTPSENVIFAARLLLHNLVNMSDQFPSPLGPSVVSAQRIELDEASISGFQGLKHLQTFIVGNQLLSIVRTPRREDGSFVVTAIVRDAGGRHVWHAANYFGGGVDPFHSAPYRAVDDRNVLAVAPPDPVDPQFLEELFLFLGPDERDRHYRLLDKVNQRRETERIALSSRHYGWNDDVSIHPPRLPQTAEALDATVVRVFLANLGFHTMQSRSRIFSIRDSPEAPFDYQTAFTGIDTSPERPQFTFGVIYVRDGTQSQSQILSSADAGSPEFQHFVANLGTEIDLNAHRGFTGRLLPDLTGPRTRYYASWDYELTYHISSLMPSRPEPSLSAKHSLLASDLVLVLWFEQVGDFIERGPFNVLQNCQAQVLIVLSPITKTLVRVNIFTRNNFYRIGPLVDDAIISTHALPTLVRQSAIYDIMQLTGLYLHHPMASRQAQLDEFIRQYRNDAPSYVYLSKIFG